ncbi:hypothetical protein J7K24_01460 [bacterium]|nr:hypothetical protein [bacterium]
MNRFKKIKQVIRIFFLISIIVVGMSFFEKNKLPSQKEILEQLYQDPVQTETSIAPFEREVGGIIYKITPLYNYELYGLIVSTHSSRSIAAYYHNKYEDFINIKDICVVWGENIRRETYRLSKFKSGPFTCYVKRKGFFDNSSFSNNHLLTENKEIAKKISKAEKGDQVYLKGYLVEYSRKNGFTRRSSTIRTDRGCEVIYVTNFQILKRANPYWHIAYTTSKYLTVIFLMVLFVIFFIEIGRPVTT